MLEVLNIVIEVRLDTEQQKYSFGGISENQCSGGNSVEETVSKNKPKNTTVKYQNVINVLEVASAPVMLVLLVILMHRIRVLVLMVKMEATVALSILCDHFSDSSGISLDAPQWLEVLVTNF